MSWFESQIRQRLQNDADDFSDAFTDISRSVTGGVSREYKNRTRVEENSVNEMLHYFGEKPVKLPNDLKNLKEKLDYACAPHGIMMRKIRLVGDWYHDAVGVMVATLKESGKVVTLTPGRISGYRFYDGELMKYVNVSKHNSSLFEEGAYVFYKPLPDGKFTLPLLIRYIFRFMSRSDVVLWLVLCTVSISLAFDLPEIVQIVFGDVIQMNEGSVLPAACFWLIGVVFSSYLVGVQKDIVTKKMCIKASSRIQTAGMMQLLELPRSFFQKYSPGDLASRIDLIGKLTESTVNALARSMYVTIMVLVCIKVTTDDYSAFIHTIFFVSIFALSVHLLSIKIYSKRMTRQLDAYSAERGMTYDTILGIQKIRQTGAEKRAFARWGRVFSKRTHIEYTPTWSVTLMKIAPTVLGFVGMLEIYLVSFTYAYNEEMAAGDFYSFFIAYGMLLTALLDLINSSQEVASIKPMVDLIAPIFRAEKDMTLLNRTQQRISGDIELSHVSFRYREDMPDVIRDISLKIKRGDYIGIVGTTGCGKSTLIRLMTGMEKPRIGAVYYDGTDIVNIAPQSLHKYTGVVEQNGRLFQGSILSNIRISAPDITNEQLWDVLEKAGIADDIREMPMGVHTVISEGDGGISGGQRQRIVIARALAHRPRIIFFDEATSMLDNITQKIISDTLDSLNCTRIVIAHRLSTVKNCKKIIVMNDGEIVETGTYDELIRRNGFFAELASKQLL